MDEEKEDRSRTDSGEMPAGGKTARAARSRKRTRRADAERARLAAIVDSSFDAIIGKDLDGTITSWNAAAQRMYGYTASEAVGRHISLIVPPHRADELEGIFARLRRGERVPPFESVRRRKDGAELTVSLTVSPILGPDGAIIGASDIQRDITDRVRAEAAQRLHTRLLDSMAEGVSLSSEDGIIVYTNPAEDRMFGYAPGELLGQPVTVLNAYPPDENARTVAEVIAELKTKGVWRGEWLNRKKDGTAFVTAARITAVESEGRQHWLCVQEDITARRQAEAERERLLVALRESEERLRLAQEAATIGTYDWDIPGGTIRWSPEMFRLHGVDPATPPDQLYDAWLRTLHPEDRERADRETRAFLAREGPLEIEFRVVPPGGSVRWIHGRGTMVWDSDGRPLRMIGVNIDVTARRAAEEALRESEQRLRDIAANFPGVIVRRVTYPDGRIEYPFVSDNAERVLGFPAAAGQSVRTVEDLAKYIAPEDLARWWAAAQAAAATLEPLEIEGRFFAPDGKVRWIRSISRPHRQPDGATVWDGITLDVTAQKEAEEALRRSEELLRLSQAAGRIGSFEWMVETGVSRYSPEYAAIYGLSPEALAGTHEGWLAYVHADDRPGVLTYQRAALARQEPEHRCEFRIVRPDGTIRWVEARARAFHEPNGQPVRIVGVNVDITERKQAEESRELLIQELDHRVKNMLAVVQAIFRQSWGSSQSVEAFESAFAGRLGAMAAAHDLLTRNRWEGSALGDVVTQALELYRQQGGRLAIRGMDEVMLRPRAATTLAMLLHELATNAAKYGALSVPRGRVELTWSVEAADTGPMLDLRWRETGGPPVTEPSRRGFGRQLIERAVEYELGGTAELSFASDGVQCHVQIPLMPEVGSRSP